MHSTRESHISEPVHCCNSKFSRWSGALCALSYFAVAAAAPLPRTMKAPKDGADLILLDAGFFQVGANQAELRNLLSNRLKAPYATLFQNEVQRQVSVAALYFDKYEVTNRQYSEFVARGGGHPSRYKDYPQFNRPTQPVTGVSWRDADGYCKWAERRLPTEDEWERAARGSDGRIWPWGNEPEASKFSGKTLGRYGATAVGSFPQGNTPEGVSDLAGNVWELTSSVWGDGAHVMKGGSFLNDLSYSRSSLRWASSKEDVGAEYLGFRCVVDADKVVGPAR